MKLFHWGAHLSEVAKVDLDVDGLSSAGDGGFPIQDSGNRDRLIPPGRAVPLIFD